jgi:hypothetical protein
MLLIRTLLRKSLKTPNAELRAIGKVLIYCAHLLRSFTPVSSAFASAKSLIWGGGNSQKRLNRYSSFPHFTNV